MLLCVLGLFLAVSYNGAVNVLPLETFGVVQNKTNTAACKQTLMDMVLDMGQRSAPPHSPAWTKCRSILQAEEFFITPGAKIFRSTTHRLVEMLEGYGVKLFDNQTVDSNVKGNNTILVEYGVYQWNNDKFCQGNHCSSIVRIIIQTEQAKAWRKGSKYLAECHRKSNCIIWDFSDSNLEYFAGSNISNSAMLIPLMFHDNLESYYPSTFVPLYKRKLDATFFGLITSRRKWFRYKNIENHDDTAPSPLSNLTITFEKSMAESRVVNAYQNSKICLVIHSYYEDSGGEYHRMNDFKRFGCIPVMEGFGDTWAVDTLERCAGVVFGNYTSLPYLVMKVLDRIKTTPNETLDDQQLAVNQWWANGIQWGSFLEQLLGQRSS